MKLHDLHGQEFELKILGYQFPDILDDEWDSNWLNIQIIVNAKAGKWEKTDPSLSTVDVETIYKWLTSIPQNNASRVIDFTEPNLKFENISNGHNFKIRIYFELESRPEWKLTEGVGNDDFFIELTLDKSELINAAQSLQEEAKLFPQRGLNKK